MRALRLAHRGDHRAAPENTLAAFRAALAIPGCDGLEFDVHLSRDRVPVVIHDETLDRVQGVPGVVAELTAAELGAHGVPTLAEVLALAAADACLDVELKGDCGAEGIAALERARGSRLGRAFVSSFEVDALETVRRLRPDWPAWLNAEDLAPATVARALALGCAGISVRSDALDAGSVARAAAAGLALAAWTVVTRAEFERVEALGVAAVCVEGEALDGGPGRGSDAGRVGSRPAASS